MAEPTLEQTRKNKIETIKNLRKTYYEMGKNKDVNTNERIHLAMHSMELQIRQDILEGIAR